MPDTPPRYQATFKIVDRQTGEVVVEDNFNTDSPVYLRERLITADLKTRKLEHGYTPADDEQAG